MSDEATRVDLGFVAMLVSGPMLAGRIGEAEHTVCEDCVNFHTYEKAEEGFGYCDICDWDVRTTGPLWPGCRGFKLRPGALGPMKRYAQAVRDRTDAALQKKDKP